MSSVAAIPALVIATRARRREQWLSPEDLRDRRVARLRRLAAAAARAPFWAAVFEKTGVRPDVIDDGEGLQRLPILDKTTVRDRSTELLTTAVTNLFTVRTSGSSGLPAMFYRSERDQAEVSAIHGRIASAFGRRTFDRQVSIGSGVPTATKGPIAYLRKLGVLPPMHRMSSHDPLEAQVAAVRRLRPQAINGYSAALEQLAEATLAAGVTDIRPRLVYTGSMPTTERCREVVAEAFGVRPLDVYAMVESGPIAFECPHRPGDYHLNDDVQIVEIVDNEGRRVPDGETGEVVITPLTLTAQPLLRYRAGDLVARRPYSCGCGRGLALIGPVEGRARMIIRTPDGRALNQAGFGSAFRGHHGVQRWQVRQTAPDALRVLVVTQPPWADTGREQTLALLTARVGTAMRIEVESVEDIPLTAGGKFQAIVPLPEDGAPQD